VIETKDIKEFGKQIGIDQIRITTAEPFDQALAGFQSQRKKGLFTERRHRHFENIEQFYNVHLRFPAARSIIATCQGYLTDEKTDLSQPGNPHGLIARYTWRNHYQGLKKKLKKLGDFIHKQSGASFHAYSNGPVAEKPIAVRSGIGYYGKHSVIINKNFGSWIVLGEILTDIELEPDKQLDIDCGQCQDCINACPTHAIVAPYIIDRNRCIQELTNWVGILPDDIARVWGKRLYGCTVCQDVCPKNSKVAMRSPREDPGYVGPSISLAAILDMAEEEYRERYMNNQITARWINFSAIKRNALVCLGNIGDKKFLPVLERFKKSDDNIYAMTAQWAINRIANGSV
jgi:epoxyqueuosine reductase